MNETTMREIDRRVMEAVKKCVAKGVEPKEAVRRHVECLMAEWPAVALHYAAWLAKGRR